MSRPLKGGLARAYDSHLNTRGRAYAAFCAPYVARFGGKLPVALAPVLRELWRVNVELDQLAADHQAARARHRRTDERRLRRALNASRKDFARLLGHIERAAEHQSVDWVAALEQHRG